MRRVIVTGANGFIGTSLICKLIEKNVLVVAVDISFQNTRLPETKGIVRVETNLESVASMMACIPEAEYDAFYHLAWRGVNGAEKADPVIQLENARMALRCAQFAKQIGCKKYLCAGTVAEQSVHSLGNLERTNGGMMYGVAKHCAHLMLEAYCKNAGLNYVWMQFSNIYGPDNKTGNLISYALGELLADGEASFGPALQPYDFIFVDDLIEAIYRIGESHTTQNSYFIGSGEPRILKDYLLEIGEACGKSALIKIGARADDGIVYGFGMFDTSALVSDIGQFTSRSFSEGIRYTIEKY